MDEPYRVEPRLGGVLGLASARLVNVVGDALGFRLSKGLDVATRAFATPCADSAGGPALPQTSWSSCPRSERQRDKGAKVLREWDLRPYLTVQAGPSVCGR